jgi:phosphoketolase
MPVKRERESTLQAKIVRELTAHGALVWKWESPGRRGVPDLIVLQNGVVGFMEVKTAAGRLSAGQTRMIQRMLRAGALVYLVRSIDDAVKALADMGHERG